MADDAMTPADRVAGRAMGAFDEFVAAYRKTAYENVRLRAALDEALDGWSEGLAEDVRQRAPAKTEAAFDHIAELRKEHGL
jgi:predicted acylesterase/phospholipase RssA